MPMDALTVEPVLTARRRLFRFAMRNTMRALLRTVTDFEVTGLDRVPAEGPLLVVMNHLGLLDSPLLLAAFPRSLDGVILDQMLGAPVVGLLLRWYGVIPVKRDRFDRTVLQQAVAVLRSGRAVAIAPEAGVSDSGALRQARAGAAGRLYRHRVRARSGGCGGGKSELPWSGAPGFLAAGPPQAARQTDLWPAVQPGSGRAELARKTPGPSPGY